MTDVRIRQALLSVSDKTGLVDLARALARLDVAILSTGGTARLLAANGIKVTEVADYTGYPEMLDGRLKTLHPKIHGGLLARRDQPEHMAAIKDAGTEPIDLVAVNLYPFQQAVARPDCSFDEAVENIDIGGPTMVRAAAKNHAAVAVVTDPADYGAVVAELERSGGRLSAATRLALAKKAFAHTAAYDAAIANYLTSLDAALQPGPFPDRLTLQWEKAQALRYGENPHQLAAFYRDPAPVAGSLARYRQLQGKELSYNNIVDIDAALQLAMEFSDPAAAIIKHTNPSGVALSKRRLVDAFKKARECDPVSAYGGVIGFNRHVGAETAKEVASTFFEAVIAPGYDKEARRILSAKANLRVLETGGEFRWGTAARHEMKKVSGGLLLQSRDRHAVSSSSLKVVTKRAPTAEELEA
ncbi:MAG TPA: bifunctional phosphoribosylaminoimidazolecarboxamide formyltransferase/IMP cyclohydrolase, partial [Thermoanaerobaculia bacterium]